MQGDRTGSSASGPLLEAALGQFATSGFEGASLQRIAADAGLSKSSVLYHFASKEALLDAALRPAVDALRILVGEIAALDGASDRRAFAERFVDLLYAHRLAAAILINHGQGLQGHAAIDEADALVRELAGRIAPAGATTADATRFGVGLAGAAFMLVAADRWSPGPIPDDLLRTALTDVVAELLLGGTAPLPV